MKCPKCGYSRRANDNSFVPGNECPSCGIVYGKHDKAANSNKNVSGSSDPLRNPSPVSASSLQKARERVDRRLRKQQGAKVKDSRHIQTLEIARRLTAEGVRQRQAEWKKRNSEKNTKTTPLSETVDHQKHSDSSDQPPAGQAPQKANKQLASTIARALKKKKKRKLGQPPETAEPSAQSLKGQSPSSKAAPNFEAGPPVPSLKEERAHASTLQPDPAAAPAGNEPIQLFQNKPKFFVNNCSTKPPSLKEMLKDFDPPHSERVAAAKAFNPFHKITFSGLTRLLPLVAWLILGAGVIGAILSWTTLGDVQAAMRTPSPTGNDTLPLGLLLGFAYLATGVLGFAFFWVSSLISRQLKDIHRLLMLQPVSQTEPIEAQRMVTE